MNIKKCISTLLATTLLSVTLISCGGGGGQTTFPQVADPSDFTNPQVTEDEQTTTTTSPASETDATTTEATEAAEPTTTTDNSGGTSGSDEDGIGIDGPGSDIGITVDKGLLNVRMTFPGAMLAEDLVLDEYKAENDFTDAEFNADGSLTVTMTRGRYDEMIDGLRTAINDALEGMVADTSIGYVTGFEVKDDFSTITIEVDGEAYAEAFDMSLFTVSLLVSFYKMYSGDPLEYNISIIDNVTKEVLDSAIQPEPAS